MEVFYEQRRLLNGETFTLPQMRRYVKRKIHLAR